jgi:hypothetical protein
VVILWCPPKLTSRHVLIDVLSCRLSSTIDMFLPNIRYACDAIRGLPVVMVVPILDVILQAGFFNVFMVDNFFRRHIFTVMMLFVARLLKVENWTSHRQSAKQTSPGSHHVRLKKRSRSGTSRRSMSMVAMSAHFG